MKNYKIPELTDTWPELHPHAEALGAFRILPNGDGRAYTVVQAVSGRLAVNRIIRIARAVGYIAPAGTRASYGVLDVWSSDDIVQDYAIPHARAWRWWYRNLGLRVDYATEQSTK